MYCTMQLQAIERRGGLMIHATRTFIFLVAVVRMELYGVV